ncbi:hypothetical protein NLI96_g714 [Meripilus lineatus]|uniref:Uncharacterized protein n=1 Tax=Meripilus lineatus TaxID=2056292 RepID=A0AAD5YLR1_9APHY|nr:hypothetical protein NLI96_g714 [Physisporinus lineatus]
MSPITLTMEGFYTYNNSHLSDLDNGYMKFDMIYDPATSTVEAKGKDNAGPFTILGLFDGRNLRWIKKYPTWEWKYIGKVVESLGPNAYYFAGGWGNGTVQDGTFVFTATEPHTIHALVNGEWEGQYLYNSDPCRKDAPMHLCLSVDANSHLVADGFDGVGGFSLKGTINGRKVYWRKTYTSGLAWDYNGDISDDGKHITGTWGTGSTVDGTFTLNKTRGIALETVKKLMPSASHVCGHLEGGCAVSKIDKHDLDKLVVGFQSVKA